MIDYTAILQARHPFEAGGLHFTLSLLWSQISAVVCVVLYQQFYKNEKNKRSKIDAVTLLSIVGSLVLVWAVSFYCFLKKINPKYLHTFFGTMTASQYCAHMFRTGDDRTKSTLFGKNELMWAPIRSEVRAWTHENWDGWKEEKPDWFTEHFISTVPDEFIPRVEKDRRRSSALLNMLGFNGGDDEKSSRKDNINSSGDKSTRKVVPAKFGGTS